MSDPLPAAEALKLLRTRRALTQTAASKLEGAPDYRTLSHWETRRKLPSLRLLARYLQALGLDFADFQLALDQITGRADERVAARLTEIERRLDDLERIHRAAAEDTP